MTSINDVAGAVEVARRAARSVGHPRGGGQTAAIERLVCRQALDHLDRAAAHLEPLVTERRRRRA